MEQDIRQFNAEEVTAILDEMQFWNRQLDEHARLIRSGVDVGEDNIIREADDFVGLYDRLLSRLNVPNLNNNPAAVVQLLHQTKALAVNLREFKIEARDGIAACRIKAILPADLLDHIRRELDFFIGNLNAVTGGPIPTWEDLGLDHSDRKVSIVPRMLLHEVGGTTVYQVSLEELLFWLHISGDHAYLLSRYFIPGQQAQFTQETSDFGAGFDRLRQQTFQGMDQRGNLSMMMQMSADLNQTWLNYLLELNRRLATCQIPEHQTNFWPALVVHIIREQTYFQSVLTILLPMVGMENC